MNFDTAVEVDVEASQKLIQTSGECLKENLCENQLMGKENFIIPVKVDQINNVYLRFNYNYVFIY